MPPEKVLFYYEVATKIIAAENGNNADDRPENMIGAGPDDPLGFQM